MASFCRSEGANDFHGLIPNVYLLMEIFHTAYNLNIIANLKSTLFSNLPQLSSLQRFAPPFSAVLQIAHKVQL